MPGRISTVTISTTDVRRSCELYSQWLGYEVVQESGLDEATARLWGLPGLAGRPSAVLAPGGTGDTFLRFVQGPAAPGYVPFRHLGWNAAEHTVADVDALGARLAGSPFRIIGPPADLSFSDRIRAMQVVGPDNEVLYLTEIKGEVPGFALPFAQHMVDRVFIMILGGADLGELMHWYQARLGVPPSPVMEAVVSVLSNTYGQDPKTMHRISAMPLADACYIEADQMPAAALPRPTAPGELPPALAMVSFDVDTLPQGLDWFSPPAALESFPYRGRRAAACRGPTGELIELIERSA
jgi:catechol 2,3-dioxygenase-like lactoylglutathione lyase family enzyme